MNTLGIAGTAAADAASALGTPILDPQRANENETDDDNNNNNTDDHDDDDDDENGCPTMGVKEESSCGSETIALQEGGWVKSKIVGW